MRGPAVSSWEDLTDATVDAWAAIALLQEELGRPPRLSEIGGELSVNRNSLGNLLSWRIRPLCQVGWLAKVGNGYYRAVEAP